MNKIFRLPEEFEPKIAELFIKVAEGLRLRAYQCSAGIWTVGYGHTGGVKKNTVIDEVEAQHLLEKDLNDCHYVLKKWVNKCTEGQYIALMSFVFNFGEVNFAKSALLKKHNAEDYKGAAEEFGRWVYAKDPKTGKKAPVPGLVSRRKEEAKQYLRGLV